MSKARYYKILSHIAVRGDYCYEECPFLHDVGGRSGEQYSCRLYYEDIHDWKRCYQCRKVTDSVGDADCIIDGTKEMTRLNDYKLFAERALDNKDDTDYWLKFILDLIKEAMNKNVVP